MSALVGATILFAVGALIGGVAGTLLWVCAFLALAAELLRLVSPSERRAVAERAKREWRGTTSLDELLVLDEIRLLTLDPAATEELAAIATRFARERGIDPLAVARAMVDAVEGELDALSSLGWRLRDGLSRAERILELRSRR
jgi:hypothetical protein